MKQLLTLIVVVGIIFLSSGCKEKATEASNQTSQSPFTCKVDGTPWSANAPTAPVVVTLVGNTLNITATSMMNLSVEQIILSIS